MGEPQVDEVSPSAGTGAGLIAFLNYAIKKNELVEATAVALRTGVKRVLETDEQFAETEIAAMDLEEVVRRFRNKFRGQMKDQSLADYEKRFCQTVEMYKKWLADDPTWRPAARKATAPRRSPGDKASANGAGIVTDNKVPPHENVTMTASSSSAADAAVDMIDYPYPVRPGLLAHISLPADLTAKEAERIAKFVASLAFEERLAITSGPLTAEMATR